MTSLRQSARLQLERLESRELLSGNPAIGMNVERVADYMAAWMFTDAFKESRPFMPEVYNTVAHTLTPDLGHVLPLALDAQGWATQLSSGVNAQGQPLQQVLDTVMFDGLDGHYPAGIYTAQWTGTGTIQWGGDAQVVQSGRAPDGQYWARLNVSPGNLGVRMRIAAMNPTDPIHNVHVWMPDYNGQSFVGKVWSPGAAVSPFHPLFLQRLGPFHTLRFMQDEAVVTSHVVHWSDRRPVDYETQMVAPNGFQNGMAPEYMIELCNELHADLWVNVPHMAQDDYITNLALLVRGRLAPGLKAYVEWSNEVWNGAPGFVPHQWVTQQLALPQNAGVTFAQFVAREDRHTFDLWSRVFAGQTGRLVRVVAGFENNPSYAAAVLSNMGGDFDAVACAGYFGPTPPQIAGYSATTTEDQVMRDILAAIPTDLNFLAAHKQLADRYSAALGRHIQLATYEGGPSLIGHYQPYQAAFLAAGQDPRMYNAYQLYLTGVRQIGLDLFMQYEFTGRQVNNPYGVFGVLNYQDQPIAAAPKYRALLDAVSGALYPPSSPAPVLSMLPPLPTSAPAATLLHIDGVG
jgi:hypothetical protein